MQEFGGQVTWHFFPFLRGFLPAVLLIFVAGTAAGQGNASNEVCAGCHDVGEKLQKSAHASVACSTCHVKHEEYPHPANIPKPECKTCHADEVARFNLSVHGQEIQKGNEAAPNCTLCHGDAHELASTKTAAFRLGVPDTCGMCHSAVAAQYQQSVHGKAVAAGVLAAPVCTDCHGIHNIERPKSRTSSVNPINQPETCGRCHGDLRLSSRFGLPPDRITSFESSYHGLALKAGNQTVASCSSCHGVHNILPSSDPKSTINPKNLGKTCGKCHPGAGRRFAIGRIHAIESQTEFLPVRLARQAYLILIPLTLGFMLLHHGGDYIRKLWRNRLSPASRELVRPMVSTVHPEIRMYRFERYLHATLGVSFLVLVWTGFALKYPGQWWSYPFIALEGKYPLRGIIHRAAGVVMLTCGITHIVSLVVNKKLRNHWLELIPRREDAYQIIANTAYCLGLRRDKPAISPHSYIEKMEYWAVVWGTVIMGLTGIMLWSVTPVLTYLPQAKDWLDLATVVHFYEAVLAAASIVIWHFYMVIFDPEVYPMDIAWLTGKSLRIRHEQHIPDD